MTPDNSPETLERMESMLDTLSGLADTIAKPEVPWKIKQRPAWLEQCNLLLPQVADEQTLSANV